MLELDTEQLDTIMDCIETQVNEYGWRDGFDKQAHVALYAQLMQEYNDRLTPTEPRQLPYGWTLD